MQEFRVLWCEDNIGHFDNIIEHIDEHCKKHSRKFCYDHYDRYPEELTGELFTGQYSAMFIDLNLKNGQKGTEVIEIIRDYGAYVDILLYSNNPEDLRQVTEGDNFVEGVFIHATLKGIKQKMCDIIDQVVYKEHMAIYREEEYKKSLQDSE